MKLRTRLALGFTTTSLLAAGGVFLRALVVIDRAGSESLTVRREICVRNLRNGHREEQLLLAKEAEGIARELEARPLSEVELQALLRERLDDENLDLLDLIRPDGEFEASAELPRTIRSASRVDLAAARRSTLEPGLVEVPMDPLDEAGRIRLAFAATRPAPGGYLLVGRVVESSSGLFSLTGERLGRLEGLAAGRTFEVPHSGPVELLFTTSLSVAPSFDAPDELSRSVRLSVDYFDEGASARRGLLLGFVAISGVVLAAGFFLATFLAGRFAAPVDALAKGARELARGDLEYRVPDAPPGSGDELSELVTSFNRMASDLKESRERLRQSERVAAWREIARRIAHEIKNPLTPIQMAIETTRRAYREKRAEFAEIFEESARAILEEVESLKRLVREFSEFARMPEPLLAPGDLNETASAALRVFSGLPEGVSLRTELDPSLPTILIDRAQLSRAIVNLVANAAEAIRGGTGRGSIILRTARAPGMVELHVLDDGPGVPPQERARIFTPYYTTKAEGTGLGLAIVQRIIADHGGDIRVGTAPSGGADFVIRLRLP